MGICKNSKIHTDSPTLYFSNVAKKKNKTVCVNAGHGTRGGESVKTLCHPDGSKQGYRRKYKSGEP
ncbi:MAG: hypothetical protein ACLUR5_06140 [Eubacterium ventriosum]